MANPVETLLEACEKACARDSSCAILFVSAEHPYAIRFSGNDSTFEIPVDPPGVHLLGFSRSPSPRLRRACSAAGLEIFGE